MLWSREFSRDATLTAAAIPLADAGGRREPPRQTARSREEFSSTSSIVVSPMRTLLRPS
jgi:hypothetical protein